MSGCHEDAPAGAKPAGVARPLVAIAGNPNTGKTTLFNCLTGKTAKVGNYPGITVDRHTGKVALPRDGEDLEVLVLDVPGTYSLSARSEEERIAIEAIAGLSGNPRPDAVIVVVDATQLARNLYLALQVIELGLPVVLAISMVDVLTAKGKHIDPVALSRELGVPAIAVTASTCTGTEDLKRAVAVALENPAAGPVKWAPDDEVFARLGAITKALPADWDATGPRERALTLWALLSLDDNDEHTGIPDALRTAVIEARAAAEADGTNLEHAAIEARYAWIDSHEKAFHPTGTERVHQRTDQLDKLLLHPVFGFAIFLVTMTIVFQALFSWANPMISAVEIAVGGFGDLVGGLLPAGLLHDLIVDGLIGGVGAVLVFLPQILLLFLFIGVMEDTGYMSRVAFLMDRVMRSVGLHGRAFVPMLSGFACAVPAIMATRTMERKRDRLLTMMVVPLMTCSARLPVYTLLIAIMVPVGSGGTWTQGLLMAGMYLFSTVLALIVAGVLSRTIIRGPRVPLILEMPPYRMPHWPSVLRMLRERSMVFVRDAGGVILVASMVIWALLEFPREPELQRDFAAERVALVEEGAAPEALSVLDMAEASERLEASYGGRLGHMIEPVIEPLGFDWKMGIGLVGAFAAREVFVSTMGVVYGLGGDEDENSPLLRDRLRAEKRPDGSPAFTPLVCFSLLVFFALACQCSSTLAMVYRETKTLRWPVFLFTYTLVLAWLASFAVFQLGG